MKNECMRKILWFYSAGKTIRNVPVLFTTSDCGFSYRNFEPEETLYGYVEGKLIDLQ